MASFDMPPVPTGAVPRHRDHSAPQTIADFNALMREVKLANLPSSVAAHSGDSNTTPSDDGSKDPGESYEDHPLFPVLLAAIQQAMYGKGERHGGARTPFLEQPWKHYADMHGRGFLTGQAAKKLEEAASTRSGKAFEQEVFGAIVYCGMAVLYERNTVL